uniref:G_PROTEIN_RECEP_F1_2 domain-containing protein n=1 Tax=Loa loa TaxID=7209 RepID=A0A1I7W1V0_LOALO
MMIVFGNFVVLLAVLIDRELRRLATNKFIASLAISDLLVGIVVMPLSLYATVNEIRWDLGDRWCQFHLVTGVFSTTASIVHLTAISLDRYFAIMFPTEYQRHSLATSIFTYIIMIWLVSFAVSSTLFMEKSLDEDGFCWIKNPQYLVISQHGTRVKQISNTGNDCIWNGTLETKFEKSSNKQNATQRRCSSPATVGETLKEDRLISSKKRMSITLDPPNNHCLLLDHITSFTDKNPPEDSNIRYDESLLKTSVIGITENDSMKLPVVSVSFNDSKTLDETSNSKESLPALESSMLLALPKSVSNFPPTPTLSASTVVSLKVPKWGCCTSPISTVRSNSSRSSCASTSDSGDISRNVSGMWPSLRAVVYTHGSNSLAAAKNPVTDNITRSEEQPRRATTSRGRLRKIALQVTRAIRRKRRESLAIRRETRATGVVAAILSK